MATATLPNEGATLSKDKLNGLDHDFILNLVGETRQRNLYGPKLMDFIESDEAAINPAETWPIEFGQKNAATMYQGFLKAAKDAKLTEVLRIIQSDGAVYILHNERVAILAQQAADDDNE